ncbi:MAG TPA: hypothetical protein PKE20_04965 [Promineifilum sp.]|nr:hypothetical protein [Promineifilum sp.]
MLQLRLEMGKMVGPESAPRIQIIIVEQHAAVRRALRKRLSATPQLDVIAAVSEPAEALAYLSSPAARGSVCASTVVLLGLQNGSDEELFRILDIVEQMARSAAVIVLAPYADEVERLLLQQAGASNYLLKYIDSDRLILEIEAASHHGPTSIANFLS